MTGVTDSVIREMKERVLLPQGESLHEPFLNGLLRQEVKYFTLYLRGAEWLSLGLE